MKILVRGLNGAGKGTQGHWKGLESGRACRGVYIGPLARKGVCIGKGFGRPGSGTGGPNVSAGDLNVRIRVYEAQLRNRIRSCEKLCSA